MLLAVGSCLGIGDSEKGGVFAGGKKYSTKAEREYIEEKVGIGSIWMRRQGVCSKKRT
jgi:hypothetical protein